MAMNSAMLAALQARNPLLVHLLRIELPGYTIRLVDGSGYVIWGSEVFTGSDNEFGTIAGFGDFTESEGTEAPRQARPRQAGEGPDGLQPQPPQGAGGIGIDVPQCDGTADRGKRFCRREADARCTAGDDDRSGGGAEIGGGGHTDIPFNSDLYSGKSGSR